MPLTACPECAGPRLTPHPAGLVIRHTPTCSLGIAEDSSKAADADRMGRGRDGKVRFFRPTTPTERLLLSVVVGVAVPTESFTRVTRVTDGGGILRRDWRNVDLDAVTP